MSFSERRDAVVAGADAAERARAFGGDLDLLMLGLLPSAAAFADPPVSGFRVGAIARGASGALYAGANLEFAGMPLGCSVHAEQAAVANARRHGERRIVAFAVSAAPCGHCRQFLCELPAFAEIRVLQPDRAPATLAALLPAAFGPRDLSVAADPLDGMREALALERDGDDPLLRAACEAAETAYVPYSGVLAGAAVRTADGAIHRGASLESAAYNPSLPALQDALSAVALSGAAFEGIAACALVETAGAISQRAHAAALLEALHIAPPRYALARRR